MQAIKEFLDGSRFAKFEISLASADASFRRYFRLTLANESYIVMDSSRELNSLKPFVEVTQRLRDAKVNAPQIYLQDVAKGFLVLEDFGSSDLLDVLDASNYEKLYKIAIEAIIKMQDADAKGLPLYDDAFLKFEMSLIQEWFLESYIGINYDAKMIQNSLSIISDEVLKQPQGFFVHRDFHSRNIMYIDEKNLGIIDYQDAMSGAVTYDLVSLLKDLYVEWSEEKMQELALYFRDAKGLDVSDEEFIRWFDFMGLQRHIKVLGIFARLYLRDAKDGYLKDLPLTLKYVVNTLEKYDELKELRSLLLSITLPKLNT